MARTNRKLLNTGWAVVLISALYIWFFVFNRYHLWNLEQNQLFLFDRDYIFDFFKKPGGLISLAGAFSTQFFHIPWLGALILTGTATLVLLITIRIIRIYNGHMLFLSALPVIVLACMINDHNFDFAYAIGWLLYLMTFSFYARIHNNRNRYICGFIFFLALYPVAGFFSFLLVPAIIIHELLHEKQGNRIRYILLLLITAFFIPVVLQQFLFLISPVASWFLPMNALYLSSSKIHLIILSLSFPLVLLVLIVKYKERQIYNYIASFALVISVFYFSYKTYERKNEHFLRIDHMYYKGDWNEVLRLTGTYPGNNRLVIYYTNLALARQGLLSERMFHYHQSGSDGLWLDWSRNETAPLYGSEFFYTSGYLNEAFRWTFEAMEMNEMSPRLLIRLIGICLLNHESDLASKYITYLEKSLFYREEAARYKEQKIESAKKLMVRQDFISTGNHQYELRKLIDNLPDNKSAYEYLMASFLLDRNLEMFASELYRLGKLGYKKIPVHYQEALILYQGLTGKNATPAGYSIDQSILKQFHDYAAAYAANRHSMQKASLVLGKKFGHTFWYYMQFGKTSNSQ